jgi:hypothetical protein
LERYEVGAGLGPRERPRVALLAICTQAFGFGVSFDREALPLVVVNQDQTEAAPSPWIGTAEGPRAGPWQTAWFLVPGAGRADLHLARQHHAVHRGAQHRVVEGQAGLARARTGILQGGVGALCPSDVHVELRLGDGLGLERAPGALGAPGSASDVAIVPAPRRW